MEVAQPEWRQNKLKQPHPGHHVVQLVIGQFIIITQPVAVENKGADNGLHQVVGW